MKLRITLLCTLAMAVLVAMALAAPPRDDIAEHRDCGRCGMDRKAFGYSRMLIVYGDGSEAAVCSLHCAVIELDQHREKPVKSLLVADRDTRQLIEASTAVWVVGGKKRGVMTDLAKWAFGTTAAAQRFVDTERGRIVSWEQALAAAREDARPQGR